MNPCFISVIVCTYNRAEYLGKCLESLANQSLQVTAYEVILIDNCSTDHTHKVYHSFEEKNQHIHFRVCSENKQGLSFARNRGIAEAKGNILVFIDDDAIASYNYLREIWLYFSSGKTAIAGGGKILPMYETQQPAWMTVFLMPLVSVINLGNRVRFFPGNRFPIGANMFFRREAFIKYSDFNTSLGRMGQELLGGEEKELMLRMAAAREKIVYLPDAYVHHFIPADRLNPSFIIRQAIGIGKSEIIRAKAAGKPRIFVLIPELAKWAASIVLFAMYLLKLDLPKAKMMVKFRYFVSYGMISQLKS